MKIEGTRVIHDFTQWPADLNGALDAEIRRHDAEAKRMERINATIRRLEASPVTSGPIRMASRKRVPFWVRLVWWGLSAFTCLVWALSVKAAFDLFGG